MSAVDPELPERESHLCLVPHHGITSFKGMGYPRGSPAARETKILYVIDQMAFVQENTCPVFAFFAAAALAATFWARGRQAKRALRASPRHMIRPAGAASDGPAACSQSLLRVVIGTSMGSSRKATGQAACRAVDFILLIREWRTI